MNDLQRMYQEKHGKPFSLPKKFLPSTEVHRSRTTYLSTEKQTQTAILQWLTVHGIFHYRQNSGVDKSQGRFVRYGCPGAPDIIAVIDGKYIGIEVKDINPKAKQNENQAKFQSKLEAAGGVYLLIRSIDEFLVWVKEYMSKNG